MASDAPLSVVSEGVPEWITHDYVENVLKLYKSDTSLRISKLKLEYATKKGEGYASVMVRARVDYASGATGEKFNGTYLMKFAFDKDCYSAKCLLEFDLYNHEMNMYHKYLPALKTILKESEVNDYFYPETLHVDYEHTAIIFQDLKVKNFKLPNPVTGLSWKETIMVLEKLARMHAASAKVDELNPGIYNSLDRGLHCRHTKVFYPYFEDSLANCIRVASDWEGYEIYVDKMKKLLPNLMEYTRRCFDMKPNFFNVLTHGDLWTNNIMFQHNEQGELIDVVLFDYQFSCYTSPAIDLMFFINTSVEDSLRFDRQEELIEFYFHQLVENLRKVDYKGKIPTLSEFWDQYNHDRFYCFVASCLDRAVLSSDDCDDADYVTVMGEEEKSYKFRQKLFDHPRMQSNLKILIPYFYQKGVLDIK